MKRRTGIGFLVFIGSGIIFLIVLSMASGLIEKWLWMRQMGYKQVFWKILSIQGAMFCLAFVGVFVCIWVSLHFVMKNGSALRDENDQGNGILPARSGIAIPPLSNVVAPFIASMVALLFALISYPQWDTYLRFRWGGAFGEPDPIFN